MFYLLLCIIISTISLFDYNLFQYNDFTEVFAYFHIVFFVISLTTMILLFRRRDRTNFKLGFYAFGATLCLSVPALFFFPFGLIQLFIESKIVATVGFSVAFLFFLGLLNGMVRGRWNWKVKRIPLKFSKLPESLNGLKIVQISDIHVGSFFNNYKRVNKAIDKINSLNADYVVFTGDLVNNTVNEMHGWEPHFQRIQAKIGKYSILGNHDYGDYVKWPEDAKKKKNLNDLIEMHRTIGFTPLLNEHIQISSEKDGAYIIGVENWGKPPFRQSGDLERATAGIPDEAFQLLLSHDPSHFDLQVVGTNIDLTLSGHTHGMQFGIERFGIKFSPVQWRYKKWAGLYQEGKNFLYVNRGFGYLGYPGRAGIYPEITLLELGC